MIYRFRSSGIATPPHCCFRWLNYDGRWYQERLNNENWIYGRFGGACRCGGMPMGDLPSPKKGRLRHYRAYFYFTEKGYKKYGPAIIAEARRLGAVLRVERRKNPKKSEIAYKDQWQVALFPSKIRQLKKKGLAI